MGIRAQTDGGSLHATEFRDRRSTCLSVPLKSGGQLDLTWCFFPYPNHDVFGMPVVPDGWMPGGKGGTFDFFPYLMGYTAVPEAGFNRQSAGGNLHYVFAGFNGDLSVSYWEPGSALPFKARYSAATQYFTEYQWDTQVYFIYGGPDHPLYGRPLVRYDRNGNVRNFHYSERSSGSFKPLLRKITGDVGPAIPYFEYLNEAPAASPIHKLFVLDTETPANSRHAYFEYDNNYLTKITPPVTCAADYKLFTPGYSHQFIQKIRDGEGYTTYYEYLDNGGGPQELRKTVEPTGRIYWMN